MVSFKASFYARQIAADRIFGVKAKAVRHRISIGQYKIGIDFLCLIPYFFCTSRGLKEKRRIERKK
jgi:hypothetical protein